MAFIPFDERVKIERCERWAPRMEKYGAISGFVLTLGTEAIFITHNDNKAKKFAQKNKTVQEFIKESGELDILQRQNNNLEKEIKDVHEYYQNLEDKGVLISSEIKTLPVYHKQTQSNLTSRIDSLTTIVEMKAQHPLVEQYKHIQAPYGFGVNGSWIGLGIAAGLVLAGTKISQFLAKRYISKPLLKKAEKIREEWKDFENKRARTNEHFTPFLYENN